MLTVLLAILFALALALSALTVIDATLRGVRAYRTLVQGAAEPARRASASVVPLTPRPNASEGVTVSLRAAA